MSRTVRTAGEGREGGVGVGRGHADAVALPQRPPDHVPVAVAGLLMVLVGCLDVKNNTYGGGGEGGRG